MRLMLLPQVTGLERYESHSPSRGIPGIASVGSTVHTVIESSFLNALDFRL